MTRRDFKPVVVEESRGPKPLFVGRIADALDSVVGVVGVVVGAALAFWSLGLMVYNLYQVVVVLVSRSAWWTLSFLAMLILVAAFCFWLCSLGRRFVILACLVPLSFFISPIVKRLLT